MRRVNLELIRQNEVSQKEEDKYSCVCMCVYICVCGVCVCVCVCVCVYTYLACNTGDTRDEGLIPGSGRFPGVGNGNPLQ